MPQILSSKFNQDGRTFLPYSGRSGGVSWGGGFSRFLSHLPPCARIGPAAALCVARYVWTRRKCGRTSEGVLQSPPPLRSLTLGFSFSNDEGKTMKTRTLHLCTVALVALTVSPQRGSAGDTPQSESPEAARGQDDSERRLDVLRRAAASYEIHVGPKRQTEVVLRPEPVLHWANQVRYSLDGATFIWTAGGRPHAIGSIYSSTDQARFYLLDHEFQSLSPGPLIARRRGIAVWNPTEPGVKIAPFPEAQVPAKTGALRLVQMRRLAGRFTVIGFPYDSSSKDSWQLRLMPHPLYRYHSEEEGILDGALFAFAHGTDPDLIVVLEATNGPTPQWRYGLGRMCGLPLQVQLDEQQVWKVPLCPVRNRPDPSRVYLTFFKQPIDK